MGRVVGRRGIGEKLNEFANERRGNSGHFNESCKDCEFDMSKSTIITCTCNGEGKKKNWHKTSIDIGKGLNPLLPVISIYLKMESLGAVSSVKSRENAGIRGRMARTALSLLKN